MDYSSFDYQQPEPEKLSAVDKEIIKLLEIRKAHGIEIIFTPFNPVPAPASVLEIIRKHEHIKFFNGKPQ